VLSPIKSSALSATCRNDSTIHDANDADDDNDDGGDDDPCPF